MSIAAVVRALVEKGATPEMILAAVEAVEAASSDALTRRRAADAARQQAKRERESHVTSRDVTVTERDPLSPKEIPHTPLEITPIPETPSTPKGVSSPRPKPSARIELEAVLDAAHAAQIVEHRNRIGAPLTATAAAKLAAKLAKWPDPNEAADEMLANGWQGFEVAWLENRRTASPRTTNGHGTGPPSPKTVEQVVEERRKARAEARN